MEPNKDPITVCVSFRETKCAECGEPIRKGNFFRFENEREICLSCADLDHLVFLPSGNTALTRRASKHSTLRAVVVRFNRSRRRNERQGTLVEAAALEQAEQECLEDEDARAAARERAAERREVMDAAYLEKFAARVKELYPRCPDAECQTIAEHACQKYSGRVGRSAAAKDLERSAVVLAVRAHIRHAHTPYDRLLSRGLERYQAREEVAAKIAATARKWGEQ